MSFSSHLILVAETKAAEEAAQCLQLSQWTASHLAPVAVAIVLKSIDRRMSRPFGGIALSFDLARRREDVLNNGARLSAPDIRALGHYVLDHLVSGNKTRAVRAIADLAEIDHRRALAFLAITAAAVYAALAKMRRDLNLTTGQLRGIVKSEASNVGHTDSEVIKSVLQWVYRPNALARLTDGVRNWRVFRRFVPVHRPEEVIKA